MSNLLLSRHKRSAMLAAAFCTALALAACGGGGSDAPEHPPGGSSTPTPPPVATGDSFFAYVASLVVNLFENNEPTDIDAVTETKPENTEPEPVN
jgi:ABC-type glycerol-3-phosphate transport system substrate-binding protein